MSEENVATIRAYPRLSAGRPGCGRRISARRLRCQLVRIPPSGEWRLPGPRRGPAAFAWTTRSWSGFEYFEDETVDAGDQVNGLEPAAAWTTTKSSLSVACAPA
jgi:hypothetical protein